jgi:hypothetical protein
MHHNEPCRPSPQEENTTPLPRLTTTPISAPPSVSLDFYDDAAPFVHTPFRGKLFTLSSPGGRGATTVYSANKHQKTQLYSAPSRPRPGTSPQRSLAVDYASDDSPQVVHIRAKTAQVRFKGRGTHLHGHSYDSASSYY